MYVYRITRQEYSQDLSGYGAKLYGGRWNEKNIAVLYTCEYKSLAVLELLVHTPKQFKPPKYVILTLEIPDKITNLIKRYPVDDLPKDWDHPLANTSTQSWGSQKIITANLLGFVVPSVILKSEHNIVLNPSHQDYHQIRITNIEDFSIDKRLLNL